MTQRSGRFHRIVNSRATNGEIVIASTCQQHLGQMTSCYCVETVICAAYGYSGSVPLRG